MVTKVSLTVNQLISSDLFLGYHTSNWNPRINYFLIGKYKNSNIFNINYIYSITKKFVSIIVDLLVKNSHVWVVNEKFTLFDRGVQFSKLRTSFKEINFFNLKWCKGLLSNYKKVLMVKPTKFPHAIFVPNMQNNHFVINECFLVNIPSFGLADSVDNPLNIFYPIPGNSKSLRSLFFFYLIICKSALYSRYIVSSSFIFTSYKGVNKRSFRNVTSIFLNNYQLLLSKSYLLVNMLLFLKSKKTNLIFKKRKKPSKKNYSLLKWGFSFQLFRAYFLNILQLGLRNLIRVSFLPLYSKNFFFKTLVLLLLT